MADNNNSIIIPQIGMQKDKDILTKDSQEYTHALNAVIESWDGHSFSLQNESSDILCLSLIQKVIGTLQIPSLNKTILFTTDSKGDDNILIFDDIVVEKINITLNQEENCILSSLQNQKQTDKVVPKKIATANFGWNISNKVNIKYKLTDCTLNLYFVDGVNPDRFIYFSLPNYLVLEDFKQINTLTIGTCDEVYFDIIDVDKTNFNQNISYPTISLTEETGGTLQEGVYQIFTAYSTSKGIPLSSYNNSQPFPIFEKQIKEIEGIAYDTNKAIKITINDISLNSIYKYLNIAVGITINNYTSYFSVTTVPITATITYIYNSNLNNIASSEQEILAKYPYYENSKLIETGNNYLFKAKVAEFDKINVQRIANLLQLEAVTIKVDAEFYKKPENSHKYKSYLRDEVYVFGLELITKEGEVSGVATIPNRPPNNLDLTTVNNNDVLNLNKSFHWQVYNTGYKTSSPHTTEVWETFDFAYYQSTEKYPNNKEIYGDLCGEYIRLHKFPDCSVSHIHDGKAVEVAGTYNKEVNLFPMGVRIKNANQIANILDFCASEKIISQKQRDRIIGYRLVRVNRAGNKSIVAKGLLYDMWNYEKPSVYDEKDTCSTKNKYYYPSIGFNDLRTDPFISTNANHYKYENFDKGIQIPAAHGFEATGKYTFHSPDTSFVSPTLGTVLKIETEEYGESKGFFNVAENQAQYKLLTYNHYNVATLIARFIGNNTIHKSDNASGTGQAIGSSLGGIIGSAIPGVGTAIGGIAGGLIGTLAGGNNDVTSSLQRNATILFQTEKLLQLFKNLSDYEKLQYQYQAVGKYKGYTTIPNAGNKQRKVLTSSYLNSTKQSLEGNILVNNSFRESSVYLQLDGKLLPSCTVEDKSKNKLTDSISTPSTNQCKKYKVVLNGQNLPNQAGIYVAYQDCLGIPQRYVTLIAETITILASVPPLTSSIMTVTEITPCPECQQTVYTVKDCDCKGVEMTAPISSYYGSIKNEKSNQYGAINGMQYIDITNGEVTKLTENKIYFGGDTFITPFAFKRKHSYFNSTSFGLPDDTDMYYQDLGNVGYPTYFFNTKETNRDIKPSTNLLFDLFQFGNFAGSTYNFWGSLFGNNQFDSAKNILNNFSAFAFDPLLWIKAPNFYLDCYDNNIKSKPLKLFSFKAVKGIMYLYNYAIPYFYCESDINTFYRHGKNNKEYDFYPHQADLNYWLQEKNVAINQDNFYFYDKTYSKQNKEGFHYVNDINFQPYKECKTIHNNRIIYSMQGGEIDDSDLKDSYLINKALDAHDFTLVNGELTGLHEIESEKLLVTFENNTQVFSAFSTIETSGGVAQLGNGGLFRNKPQEFSKSELGYIGSQHNNIKSTEFGHILIDAKRGQVFLIGTNGSGIKELSKDGMRNWMKTYLPFTIDKYFKEIDIDQSYNGIGISVCYDKKWHRVLITKLDYQPKFKEIVYKNNQFYYGILPVKLTDIKYFYNKSFTISYNFNSTNWTSFHSYLPSYYIENNNYFLAGNNNTNKIWGHNLIVNSHQVFEGKLYPFEVELNDKYSMVNKQLQSVNYLLDSIVYKDNNPIYNKVGMNKAIIYNDHQTTGTLLLESTNNDNLFLNKNYPILEPEITKVLQTKKENIFSFNQFKNRKFNNESNFLQEKNGVTKHVNLKTIGINYNYNPITGKTNTIKLIQDKYSNYKLIFKLASFKTNNSIR